MSDDTFRVLGLLMAVVATITLFGAMAMLISRVEGSDRSYMDPLPGKLRMIWPVVRFVEHYSARYLGVEQLERYRTQLVRAGLYYMYTPEEFFALKLVSCAMLSLIAALALALTDIGVFPAVLAAAALGFMMPSISLAEHRKKREQQIIKMLPVYLDFLTMAVEAGLSFGGAMAQAIANGPRGVFRQELERVTRDVKAGATRMDALQTMAERLDIKEVTSLVTAILQSEKTGGSIGATLRIQADQRRVERFLRAEKLAMEAPVKLIFPLVAFIFPTTFIVLGFPIAMKFLHTLG